MSCRPRLSVVRDVIGQTASNPPLPTTRDTEHLATSLRQPSSTFFFLTGTQEH